MQTLTYKSETPIGFSPMQSSRVAPRKGGFDVNVDTDDSIYQLAMRATGESERYLGRLDITYMAPRQNQLVFVHKNRYDHSKLVGITSANGLDLKKPENKTSEAFEENYYLVGINSLDIKLNNEGKAVGSSMKVYSGGLDDVRVHASVRDGDFLYWEMPSWKDTEMTNPTLSKELVAPRVLPFKGETLLSVIMENNGLKDGSITKQQVVDVYKELSKKKENRIFAQALERCSKGGMCRIRWISSK